MYSALATTYPAHGKGNKSNTSCSNCQLLTFSCKTFTGISLFKSAQAGVGQLFISRRVLKILESYKKVSL